MRERARCAFLKGGKRRCKKKARPVYEAFLGLSSSNNIIEWLDKTSGERTIAIQNKREVDYLVKMFACKEVN